MFECIFTTFLDSISECDKLTLCKFYGIFMSSICYIYVCYTAVYQMFGCMACHTVDGSAAKAVAEGQVVGPTWKSVPPP